MLKNGSLLFLLVISISGCSLLSDKLYSYEYICDENDSDCLRGRYTDIDFITPMSTGLIKPVDTKDFEYVLDIYNKSLTGEVIRVNKVNDIIRLLTSNIEDQSRLYSYVFKKKYFNIKYLKSNEMIVYFQEIQALQYMQYENERQIRLMSNLGKSEFLMELKKDLKANSSRINNALKRITDTLKSEIKIEIEMLNYFKLFNSELNVENV